MIIEILDVNDNIPKWILFPYPKDNEKPPTGTSGIFITAVSADAPPETIVTQLSVSHLIVCT